MITGDDIYHDECEMCGRTNCDLMPDPRGEGLYICEVCFCYESADIEEEIAQAERDAKQ